VRSPSNTRTSYVPVSPGGRPDGRLFLLICAPHPMESRQPRLLQDRWFACWSPWRLQRGKDSNTRWLSRRRVRPLASFLGSRPRTEKEGFEPSFDPARLVDRAGLEHAEAAPEEEPL
jgi:hypothetical protein